MNPQTDLFEPRTHARRENPQTSRQAAERVAEFGGDHHAMILDVLRTKGAAGLTVHEIAAYCRLDAHAIGKRVNELERIGKIGTHIVPDGDSPDGYTVQTRKTPSGRAARVWFLAKEGGAM